MHLCFSAKCDRGDVASCQEEEEEEGGGGGGGGGAVGIVTLGDSHAKRLAHGKACTVLSTRFVWQHASTWLGLGGAVRDEVVSILDALSRTV